MNEFTQPSAQTIEEAHNRIRPFIHKTPVLECATINKIAGAKIYFKCENFQKIGAFKFRGATNAVQSLTHQERINGVATHSSGNHAQALALAAQQQGINAEIVMPSNAPKVKANAVAGYGANITFCEPTQQARVETLNKIIESTGATLIHPFDDDRIIAGQATASKELFEEKADLDYLVTPIGGGGLLSGSALSAKYFSEGTKVIGSEPEVVDDAKRSFYTGELQPSTGAQSVADGLLTGLSPRTFNIIKNHVADIFTVSDAEIVNAMKLIWERMKIVVEPSGAVPLAVVLKNMDYFKGSRIGIIVSGGNVDLGKLPF